MQNNIVYHFSMVTVLSNVMFCRLMYYNMKLLISINFISPNKQMNPFKENVKINKSYIKFENKR